MFTEEILLDTTNKSARERANTETICILPPRPRTMPTKNFQELNVPREQLYQLQFPIEEAQRWLTLVGKDNKIHRFPLPTILPKVIQTRHVAPKQLPKDVEVDRRRRQYAKINLVAELVKAGITHHELQPTEDQYYLLSEQGFHHIFPLSFFDNSNYSINTPQAWFQLGVVGGVSYPIPANAYLPVNMSLKDYTWQLAAAHDVNEPADRWQLMSLMEERFHDVPRLQFMFLAQNPHDFIERLKAAIVMRNKAEQMMYMDTIVDFVMLQSLDEANFNMFKRLENLLYKSKVHILFKRRLRTEVYLLFEHLMAYYELYKFIKLMPQEFPEFKDLDIKDFLPHAYHSPESLREREFVKSIKLQMKDKRYELLKATLFYCAGGLEAMESVATNCAHIETMTIFVCNFAKALPLNDFLQVQNQNSDNVATFLKVYWPLNITTGICVVLRALGKGWLDISLDNWSVYEMCKISKFILQTKFRMQESMQVLLEKSLDNFTHFVCDPCIQLLHVKLDYKWTNDFIQTEFPFPKPVFSLVISVNDDQRVFYSTNPEEFEPSLLEMFKKGLEKSSGVRCIDAETMQNLRFAPNLFILTVELIEDKFLVSRDLMRSCYIHGAIVLNAYARLYERFVPFFLLNVNQYLTDYAAAKKPSAQVKWDILEHKRQKEELRQILPAYITIGPFLINVDQMKQYMIKKHIEIVKRLFEYYVDRMYETNEGLLERCLGIYNKISERPISIEHLYEIRDYALTVPEQIDVLKGDIQIMWLEYELLDSFFYNLSDHQFSMKWEVYAWPHNIMTRLSTLKEEQKLDTEEFIRLHSSECMAFEERLESLNEEIQAFSLIFNPTRAPETAVEVKKTWKIISDLEKLGQTLKYRQELFDLEEFSLEFLESIINGFLPYRQLWFGCSDFLKLEEATIGNPLLQVELEEVWNSLMEIRKSLTETLAIFSEKPEIQDVAYYYINKIDEFVPIYRSIEYLRNENFIFIHWQELSQRSGIEIKYSSAMNFNYLIKKGILEFLDLIAEISERADTEAEEIKRAFEEEERRKEQEAEALLLRKQLRKCRRDIL